MRGETTSEALLVRGIFRAGVRADIGHRCIRMRQPEHGVKPTNAPDPRNNNAHLFLGLSMLTNLNPCSGDASEETLACFVVH